ncbi:MAG: 50S ribosomal protein L13 [Alphaproteobacteria bacterium]|nr:50S ribosomal protein L13 [Alphaproteobacteria bacterium]MBN2779671.1 50S ribosomal protein L13 [Alphaproteobacteria bacterium]
MKTFLKTFSAKPTDCDGKWWIIDATDLTLGRLSSFVATYLRGKHKPIYTPSMNCGDHVVIINAEKIGLSGNRKLTDKTYYRHTGHPGGIKETTPEKILDGAHPERVIEMAIKRMIPSSPLGKDQLRKLHVYAGDTHPHMGQNPTLIDFGSHNIKNIRRK